MKAPVKPRLPLNKKEEMALFTLNKRRFPRIKLASPVNYRIRGTAEFSNALSSNISVGGLSFVNDDFIPLNTHLSLEVNVLSKTLQAIGRVRWSMPLRHSDRYQSGVEFIEFNPSEKKFLSDYIQMSAENA